MNHLRSAVRNIANTHIQFWDLILIMIGDDPTGYDSPDRHLLTDQWWEEIEDAPCR